MKPLGARLDLEFDLLSLGERLEALHADRREVYEDVLFPFLLDEAISFGVIELFHFPCGHCDLAPPGGSASAALMLSTPDCSGVYRSALSFCQEMSVKVRPLRYLGSGACFS